MEDETVTEPEVVEPKAVYELHIKVPGEMKPVLRDAAELAKEMGDIPRPNLVDLMNLFIGWGFAIQKKKGEDYLGYR